jgi:hypothetical protein
LFHIVEKNRQREETTKAVDGIGIQGYRPCMADEPKPAPPVVSPERQKLATEGAGKVYDVLFEIGCGRFGEFMLAGFKKDKELDVRYAFKDPKIYEDLLKSAGGPDLVKKFARVMTETARFVSKGLGDAKWTQFGLHLRLKGKELAVELIVEPPGV